jgi:hypothetical protein
VILLEKHGPAARATSFFKARKSQIPNPNPNAQIPHKLEAGTKKCSKRNAAVLNISSLNFEFVSNFVLRIS